MGQSIAGHHSMTQTSIAIQHNRQANLVRASQRGELENLAELLAQGADPKHERSRALRMAASAGHAECVVALLPLSDPSDGAALCWAASAGHLECVKVLLPVSNPSAHGSQALLVAAQNGHAECVKLLIPVSVPKKDQSHPLRTASRNGHVECVRHLLPVSDSLFEHPELAHGALIGGQAQAMALMFEYEPRLSQRIDLSEALLSSTAAGHGDMAGLLASIIEKKELSTMAAAKHGAGSPSLRI